MKFPARTIALLCTNAVLLVALGWRVLAPTAVSDRPASTPDMIDLAKILDAPVRTADLAAVSARPVFHKTRQFVHPPVPNAPSLRPPPPSYLFAGAMLLPGRPAVAYLKHSQSGQPLKVRLGEAVEGWTVSAIDTRSVDLEFAEESISIGGTQKTTSGIVAVAPRAASSSPAGGVRVLTAPSSNSGVSGTLAPTQAPQMPQSKPRTYQPPPST